jgi:hypothetical protein
MYIIATLVGSLHCLVSSIQAIYTSQNNFSKAYVFFLMFEMERGI